MATENGAPPSAPGGEAEVWLDGLAGRAGTSERVGDGASEAAREAARDGARLRAALKPADTEQTVANAPPWQRIAEAAKRAEATTPGLPLPATPREAANESRWKRYSGGGALALALVLSVGLWTATSRDRTAQDGMRGAPTGADAVWRTDNPLQAAKDLAARLEAAGARVTLTPQEPGARLSLECAPAACAAVAEQLAPLDAAVDAAGRLTLQVRPLR